MTRLPGWRPPGSRAGSGLFDGASCPDEKCLASVPGTPAGPDLHPPAASYGDPEDQKRRADGSCRFAAHRVGCLDEMYTCRLACLWERTLCATTWRSG